MQSLSSKESFFIGLSLSNSSSYDSSICVLDRNSNIVLLDKFYFAQDIEFFFENRSKTVLNRHFCSDPFCSPINHKSTSDNQYIVFER